MKILLVHDMDAIIGGAEIVLLDTKAGLEEQGHTVKILAGSAGVAESSFADYTFRCPDKTPLGKLLFYLYNPFARQAAKAAIRSFQPDVIHLHTVTRFSPAGVRAAKRTPSIVTFHDYGLFYPRLHKILPKDAYCGYGDFACCSEHAGIVRYYYELFRTRLMQVSLRGVDQFVAPTSFIQSIAEKLGYSPVTVVSNPVNVTHHDHKTSRNSETINLLYVGRLEVEKGVIQLIQSFSLLQERFPSARLTIAGTGSLKEQLIDLAEKLKMEKKITFLGHIPGDVRDKYYASAKIFVMPSLWPEPFGLVGLEAMSFGIPVVGSGSGGMDWLKDNVNGLVADAHQPTAIFKAVSRLLEDKALYARLAKNGLKEVKSRTVANYAKELAKIYRLYAGESRLRLRTKT